jgi:aminoglycoside phosphotransferase (APT) family kinase protein
MLFRDGRVVALLDWEIAELGQPMLDVGCLALASLRRRYADPNPTGALDLSVEAVIALYDRSPAAAPWFIALTCFKYSAILGYNLGLHLAGKRPDPVYESLTETMRRLLEDGRAILDDGLSGW